MQWLKVKTRTINLPKDNIFNTLPKVKEGDVLFITSKILAIHQGRTLEIQAIKDKRKVISKEADYMMPAHKVAGSDIVLTIKDFTVIPSAGIDESNGNGYYILWPKKTNELCKKICLYLKNKYGLKNLAVVATDSHTTPLRWGVSGISIGFFGLEPTFDYRGQEDIFGRKLKYTKSNIVDAVSAMAVLLMGEGKEKTPMSILRGADFIKFTNKHSYKKFVIEPKKDLYYPILKNFKRG